MVCCVQSLSRVWLFVTPWTIACQVSLPNTNSWSLLKFMSIESVMPSNHLILCCPLLLPSSIFLSIRIFSKESVLHIRWPKYWSRTNEYSGLISFKIDWLNLLTVQGTLKNLLWHHSSKASTLLYSPTFFMLNFLYSPTFTSIHDYWKNYSFDYTDFCCIVMYLLFNMLSMLVIAFLPRSKCLCRDFGTQENKVCHCFHCFPIYLPWSDGTRCRDLSFLNVELYSAAFKSVYSS